jgi:hypothetical protein
VVLLILTLQSVLRSSRRGSNSWNELPGVRTKIRTRCDFFEIRDGVFLIPI